MANLSKDQVVDILKRAPQGVKPEDVVDELVKAGHTLDGYEPPKPQGFIERNAQTISSVARPALETAGMLGGAALAGAAAVPTGPGAVASATAGGALGYAGGKSAADLLDRSLGIKKPLQGVKEAAKETAGSVTEGAALEAGGMGAGAAIKVAPAVAKKVLGFMAEKFGGLSQETTKILEKRAPDVMRYARQGVEAAEEAAANAAKSVKASIEQYVERAGMQYRASLDQIIAQNPAYNAIRVDLQRAAGKTVEAIRQDFGFPGVDRLPNLKMVGPTGQPIQAAQGAIERVGKAAGDTELFNEFAAQFRDGLTPTQAYLLQKDISYAMRANVGKPISAALGQLKKAAIDAFDVAIGGTPLQGINKGYRMAMELADDLSKVSNADNAVTVINSAFKNRGETRDALNAISKVSPDVGEALENLFAATAGKQVAHWTAQLPPTGLKALHQAGLVGSAAVAGHNPVIGLPLLGAQMVGTSPRVYGEGFNALSKLSRIPAKLPKVPQAGPVAALAALRARRKEEK